MKTLTSSALVTVTCFSLAMAGCGDEEGGGSESGTGASGATGSTGGNGGTGGTGGTGGAGGSGAAGGAGGAGGSVSMPMTLTSPSYMDGGMIPVQHSCDGANISPALSWTPGPAETMSYAIVFRDLNNMLGHSAIWDIPASTLSLPEDVDKDFMPADVPGALQCPAYNNQPGYAGPCPGSPHVYEFTLYAVNVASLGLNPNTSSVDDVDAAAIAASVESTTLTATYTP